MKRFQYYSIVKIKHPFNNYSQILPKSIENRILINKLYYLKRNDNQKIITNFSHNFKTN